MLNHERPQSLTPDDPDPPERSRRNPRRPSGKKYVNKGIPHILPGKTQHLLRRRILHGGLSLHADYHNALQQIGYDFSVQILMILLLRHRCYISLHIFRIFLPSLYS